MRKCLISNEFHGFDELREIGGVNLLEGIKPIVLDGEGKPFEEIYYRGEILPDAISVLAEANDKNECILLKTESCKIIYDLGRSKCLDRVIISGFWDGESDYSLAEYKLFLSTDATAVFSEDNLIVHYSNGELCNTNEEVRNHCDQAFDLSDYSGRYLAIEIIKGCLCDGAARICEIGAYNDAYTEQLRFCESFGTNLIAGKTPTVKGSFIKDLTPLTDGICFDPDTRISLSTDTEFLFKLPEGTAVGAFYLVCSDYGADNCKMYASRDKERVFEEENILEFELCPLQHSHKGITAAVLALGEEIEPGYIGFSFKDGAFVDQLGVLAPIL